MSADDTTDDGRERGTGDGADDASPDDQRGTTPGDGSEDESEPASSRENTNGAGQGTATDEESEGDRREEIAERLEEGTDRAVEEFDQRIVDLLAWLLDTETRARIYVYLQQNPHSTSEEITDGTGLYPSTVREALAELADEGTVKRRKRETDGAGNNPYEYTAIAPSELVGNVAGQIQQELNTVFTLDEHLGTDRSSDGDSEPVTITVEDVETSENGPGSEDADGGESSSDDAGSGNGKAGSDPED